MRAERGERKAELMAQTTLYRRHGGMVRKALDQCHGGKGAIDWTCVLGGSELAGRHLRFIHDDVLPPGVSSGAHRHEHDEEYYLILAGTGVMTLDDQALPVQAGDITAVFPGGRHGLENTGSEDLRVLVIGIA